MQTVFIYNYMYFDLQVAILGIVFIATSGWPLTMKIVFLIVFFLLQVQAWFRWTLASLMKRKHKFPNTTCGCHCFSVIVNSHVCSDSRAS